MNNPRSRNETVYTEIIMVAYDLSYLYWPDTQSGVNIRDYKVVLNYSLLL